MPWGREQGTGFTDNSKVELTQLHQQKYLPQAEARAGFQLKEDMLLVKTNLGGKEIKGRSTNVISYYHSY